MKSTLYVLATPLGNLGDISERALQTLRQADFIAAEDTRRAGQLLMHLKIDKKPYIRCDEEKEETATESIRARLEIGEMGVLVSDAGTPAISDPGTRLVAALRKEGFSILPIPGPNAIACALSVAGFTNTPFTFYGFLAKKGVQRLGALREMTQGAHASVFFESPFRIQKTLAELASLSPTRLGFVGREMTKMHEEYIHGTLEDLSKIFSSKSPKGEFTVCIAGRTKRELRELKRNLDKMEK